MNKKQLSKDTKQAYKKLARKGVFNKDVIVDERGQWAHPGEITRIPGGNITMAGVPFPVLGVDNFGNQQIMYPEQNYQFPGDYVTEYPIMQDGGNLDGMIKARLAIDSHFGNPTARRMTNYDTRTYTFPDGRQGNVYVSSYDNYITPGIQDVNGTLQYITEPWSDENYERSQKQSMKFERPEDARYFGENYKKFAPMMDLYKEGGQVMELSEEEISKLEQAGYTVKDYDEGKVKNFIDERTEFLTGVDTPKGKDIAEFTYRLMEPEGHKAYIEDVNTRGTELLSTKQREPSLIKKGIEYIIQMLDDKEIENLRNQGYIIEDVE